MFENNQETIIAVIASIFTGASAWFAKGRFEAKKASLDIDSSLAKGADQIVETASKLLDTFQQGMKEEKEYRKKCEDDSKELYDKYKQLEEFCIKQGRDLEELKSKITK